MNRYSVHNTECIMHSYRMHWFDKIDRVMAGNWTLDFLNFKGWQGLDVSNFLHIIPASRPLYSPDAPHFSTAAAFSGAICWWISFIDHFLILCAGNSPCHIRPSILLDSSVIRPTSHPLVADFFHSTSLHKSPMGLHGEGLITLKLRKMAYCLDRSVASPGFLVDCENVSHLQKD